jgi:hypothetical protein
LGRQEIASAAASPGPQPLAPGKFRNALVTARGERRAHVALERLDTLWINTGTLCNLTCRNCYIESSPTNDALVYLSLAEAEAYFEEAQVLGTREIGFTGGEPFMNRDTVGMIRSALIRGFSVLVLTNAMRPMRRFETELKALLLEYGQQLTMRVSLDHYTRAVHEVERGPGSWDKAIDGLRWLDRHKARLAIAGRRLVEESDPGARAGYARLFRENGLAIDAADPSQLVLFPELDSLRDVPEISEACWGILNVSPGSMMCASSRMVVKRKGAERPLLTACTLLPYDDQFVTGETLADDIGKVMLNHPHCARFCVLGGASCSA